MAITAHLRTTGPATPNLQVRDDRGMPLTELALRPAVQRPEQVEPAMRDAGWVRSAGWRETTDGWLAAVTPT